MKFLVSGLLSLLVLFCFCGFHEKVMAGDLGLGVLLFSPVGLSSNYYLSNTRSLDGAISWNSGDRASSFYLHSTYLHHQRNLLSVEKEKFDVHYGVGGRLINKKTTPSDESKTELGIRGVTGLGYFWKAIPLQGFAEFALTFTVLPSSSIDAWLGLGARYYF